MGWGEHRPHVFGLRTRTFRRRLHIGSPLHQLRDSPEGMPRLVQWWRLAYR